MGNEGGFLNVLSPNYYLYRLVMETEIVELYQLIQHVEDKLSSDFSNKEYSEFLIQNLPTTRYPYSVYCDIRQAAFDCLQFIRNNQNQFDDREHIYCITP